MHNFRPAVKSGQWQVRELRERLPQPTLALTVALTVAHSYCQSVTWVWAPKPCFPGPNRFTPRVGACRRFFPVSTTLDLLRRVWLPDLWSLILGSWAGNAWPNGKHRCCQARSLREGGTKMQPENPSWVSIISWTAFRTKCTVSSERIPLTIHITSSLQYLQSICSQYGSLSSGN